MKAVTRPGPQGCKTFFMLNSAEDEIYPAYKYENLTFISRINTASESFKTRLILFFQHFSFYDS